jgi:hypothetical protein
MTRQLVLFETERLSLEKVQQIFAASAAELRLNRSNTPIFVEFYSFVGINHTIRFKDERLYVRLSDLFREAPPEIIKALSLILLAKLFRRRIPAGIQSVYRSYVNSVEMKQRSLHTRSQRGRKLFSPPQGKHFDLTAMFERLNREFFGGRIRNVNLGWSLRKSRRILGHFDPSHCSITVSRIFDEPKIPEMVVSYILFHEMLHAKFATSSNFDLKNRHSRQFKEEERKFSHYEAANQWLKVHL